MRHCDPAMHEYGIDARGVTLDALDQQLNRFGLAYLHIIEPRVKGNVTINEGQGPIAAGQLRRVFEGKIVAAGGFEADTAEAIANGVADAVAFGRHFVANPDLPLRIQEGVALTQYDRNTSGRRPW